MNLIRNAQYWIDNLNLEKHPEGGWYKEIYRSEETVQEEHLPNRFSGDRNFSTSIYFLLPSKEISAFHKIKQDELWYFHDGSSLMIHVIDENGAYFKLHLGHELEKKQRLQVVVKAGWYFAAEVNQKESYTLVGCNVAPGFNFDDFELPTRRELLDLFPKHKELIVNFTTKQI